jgi:hypothetical protein
MKVVAAVVAVVVIIAILVVTLFRVPSEETMKPPEENIITKDPAEMVLKRADVPSENYERMWSMRPSIEYLQFHWIPADVWPRVGFENGYRTMFTYGDEPKTYALECVTLRFSNIAGAETAFDAMRNSLIDRLMGWQVVTIPKIGDQSFAMELEDPVQVEIVFRKANICVAIGTSGYPPWTMDNVIVWARAIEDKIV